MPGDSYVMCRIDKTNIGTLKIINSAVFPVSYGDKFYEEVVKPENEMFNRIIYLASSNIAIGAVCCRISFPDPQANKINSSDLYIMTLGCLTHYRRRHIGSMLIDYVFDICKKIPSITRICLHVQTSNEVALKFYKKLGFQIKDTLKDYYRKIDVTSAYLLVKELS
uniref:N-acetyltransferase domain-containing protein n=1 Tax=Rhabditophanes sp. KR3021 TaxID=114890 RepID=A0AC35UAY0_9BILA